MAQRVRWKAPWWMRAYWQAKSITSTPTQPPRRQAMRAKQGPYTRCSATAASEIDYINAHATSTPAGDASEARAIHQVFGDCRPLVSSTKSMTGHECWMAGASEVVYSLLMMQNDFVAPNINLENPDEDSVKLNLAAVTTPKKIKTFLSNSFGFGGTNSSLIIREWKN
jgi:3-oxoacyl-[acyl-carrier-protein] synthase I